MKLLALFIFLAGSAIAADVQTTLAWDASAEPDVAGYRLYYGTAKGAYTDSVEVLAPQTTAAIRWPSGVLAYCVVTAFNTTGLESLPSAELCFQSALPGDRKVPSPPAGLRVVGAVTVAVEQSSDLQNWLPIYTAQIAVADPATYWRTVVSPP